MVDDFITIIGFTGTREGMTGAQAVELARQLDSRKPIHLVRHGDCVGSDAEFHAIAIKLGLRIMIHPPTDDKLRAFCKDAIWERDPKGYLARNRDIVKLSTLLIATPKEAEGQEGRGGTWYTINYAREMGLEVLTIYPNGIARHTLGHLLRGL